MMDNAIYGVVYVAHPLAIHARGSTTDLVAAHDEPDRSLVALLGLAALMGQVCRLPRRHALNRFSTSGAQFYSEGGK